MRLTLRQLDAGQPRHQNQPILEKKMGRALSSADGCKRTPEDPEDSSWFRSGSGGGIGKGARRVDLCNLDVVGCLTEPRRP
jgi:hypothetical protein